jgi:hypothetical protein
VGDSSDSATVAHVPHATRRVGALGAARVRVGAGVVAAAVTLALATVRVLANSPVSIPVVRPATAFGPARTLALFGCAVAAVALGVVADDALASVALLAAGVFGALAGLVDAAAVPAAGVLSVAGVLVAARPVSRADLEPRRRLPIGLLVAGLAVSLGVGAGVLPVSLRGGGAALALLGLALTPALGVQRIAWVTGGLVAAVTLVVGTAAPFVSGAVVLAVGAVVGVPTALVAAGVGGVTALVTDALRRGRWALAAAGVVLLAAGVPTTVQRGLAVVVALALLTAFVAAPATDRSTDDSSTTP